jgi:hypothetical protein
LAVAAISLPAFGAEITGNFESYYYMDTPNADDSETHSYYGTDGDIEITNEFDGDVTGHIKLKVNAEDHGRDVTGSVGLEELWLAGKNIFDQEGMGVKFGQFEVPFNLDYDVNITDAMTNGTALLSEGIGEIDETLGFNFNYFLGEGTGTVNVTTFTNNAGQDSDGADLDSGLFNSIVLQWDTGKGVNAFDVEGLRLVVAYAMLAGPEYKFLNGANVVDDGAAGSIISLGGTFELAEVGVMFGLEIDMTSSAAMNQVFDLDTDGTMDMFFVDQEGGMLIAFNVDYMVPDMDLTLGLTYEMLSYSEIEDVDGTGTVDIPSSTDTRMSIRAIKQLVEDVDFHFEYMMVDNSEYDQAGVSRIALGVKGTF